MFQLFDTRHQDGLTYDSGGRATLFSCPEAGVYFGRIPSGHPGIDARILPDREEAALVLSGVLSYPTSRTSEVPAPQGSWVVARPQDVHGYWNKNGTPLTLFVFQAKASPSNGKPGGRFFRPVSIKGPRFAVYEGFCSRGELLTLRPGAGFPCPAVSCRAAIITEGRVMALVGREKISLDTGEGIACVREPVEFIGLGGLSQAAVFSTIL